MNKKVYIYLITNKINGHRYIGQTVNLRARWSQHSRETSTSVIGKAINKYGKDNFKLEILEETVASLSNDREVYWIKHFNTYENKEDYNCHVGGDVQYGKYNPMFGLKGMTCPISKVTIKVAYKIRAAYINNKRESIYTLSDRFNLSTTVISKIIRGTHWAVKGESDVMRGLSGEDRSVLSKNMCLGIYNAYKVGGVSIKNLAVEFSICDATVLKICSGDHWSTEGLPDLIGDAHTSSKITKEIGLEIFKFYNGSGEYLKGTYNYYKDIYNVSYRTIQRICVKEHWSTKEII